MENNELMDYEMVENEVDEVDDEDVETEDGGINPVAVLVGVGGVAAGMLIHKFGAPIVAKVKNKVKARRAEKAAKANPVVTAEFVEADCHEEDAEE